LCIVCTTSWMSEKRWSSATRACATVAARSILFRVQSQPSKGYEEGGEEGTHALRSLPSTDSSRDSSDGRSTLSTSMTRFTRAALSEFGKGMESDLRGEG
jgi:hypothetical protein